MPDRFFSSPLPESGSCVLDGSEAHHLMHVLRITTGHVVELFDGCGLVVSAKVVAVRKRDVELHVESARREPTPVREVILGTAVPKGDRFDWLIEKATELGVTRIVPLITARSSVDPREGKLDKLRQSIIAACKQCGRNHLLELGTVSGWSDFVQSEFTNRTAFLAHPSAEALTISAEPIRLASSPSLVLAIGPEGGFTDAEVALAVRCGAKLVRLGTLILRIETAAIALAALANVATIDP